MPLAETQAESVLLSREVPGVFPGLPQDRFYQLPHIMSARAGDTTVLMDAKHETYHTLNEVSTRIWELLGSGATTPEIVERLLEEYDVARPRLESDVQATLQHLLTDRLIALGAMPVASPPVDPLSETTVEVCVGSGELRVPSVFRCAAMLFMVRTMLKTRGFARTMAWIRRRVEGSPGTASLDVAVVRRAERAIAMAGALYPGRAHCLEQSLVLYEALRRQGVSVKYCHGVKLHPFRAHAWIEYQGQVINDVPEHLKGFVRLREQLP